MRKKEENRSEDVAAPMGFVMSFLPYVILSVASIAILAVGPLNQLLSIWGTLESYFPITSLW